MVVSKVCLLGWYTEDGNFPTGCDILAGRSIPKFVYFVFYGQEKL